MAIYFSDFFRPSYLYLFGGFHSHGATPKSSIYRWISLINHPFLGVPPCMETPIYPCVFFHFFPKRALWFAHPLFSNDEMMTRLRSSATPTHEKENHMTNATGKNMENHGKLMQIPGLFFHGNIFYTESDHSRQGSRDWILGLGKKRPNTKQGTRTWMCIPLI